MFNSFDEDKFWQAIKDKDYLRLKINTVSAMRNDPTFERGEADQVMKILEENIPEIFEEEIHLDYEERLERDAWDKRYFTKLTYWFQENFAKSRVSYIKEVGAAVHQDTAQMYRESQNPVKTDTAHPKPAPQTEDRSAHPTAAPEKSNRKIPLVGIILTVSALVLSLILLIKHLTN